ncbi:hypothetical protein [Winogradskyella sp. 3972H.M.0a.05]|uniref:hypothetical protein n=1 Tax=Winogradskyella sp. 3972H.M.0a.05 TaxID=2950277 RepID=UPI003392EBD1
MRDLNEKALYFCHTHPNLFLQKHCAGCGRGMCHTCIHHDERLCPSCNKELYRSSSHYENKNRVIRALGFAVIVSLAVPAYYLYYQYSMDNNEFAANYFLVFLIGFSLAGMHYMMQDTTFIQDIRSIPFIGFKLGIIVLILLIVSGVPIFFLLYKIAILVKHHWFNKSSKPSR